MLAAREQRPGTRRVVEALRSAAREINPAERSGFAASPDWRQIFVRAQQKAIAHYRHMLATYQMPEVERARIRERIARLEDEIRNALGADDENDTAAAGYPAAA